ncbi:hypothetical protein F2Q68_00029276 [Brassica cretica]|uniref:40S ribosomal protein S30 n=1 Tax=Brassica cretica TaxID=69181 RepID=A0A8S9G7V0_BRACR|nr:hypothetical protein F2Q68_00029276 [Brassica cretica]
MGKVHGSLARAGKVRGQTPKVAKQDKKKKPRGRAHKRLQHNRRFVTAGGSDENNVDGGSGIVFFLLLVGSTSWEIMIGRSWLWRGDMINTARVYV